MQEFLRRKSEEQQVLFRRIPLVNDAQASWVLLWMCASVVGLDRVPAPLQGSWLVVVERGKEGAKPAQVRLVTVCVAEFRDQVFVVQESRQFLVALAQAKSRERHHLHCKDV